MQRAPICRSCCQPYVIKDGHKGRPSGGKIPLVLWCGHSFCDGCLSKACKGQTQMHCPECKNMTSLKDGSVNSLSPDLYVMGQITYSRMSEKNIDQLISSAGMFVATTTTNGAKSPEEQCAECNNRVATCRCSKCECLMCGVCFDKVHRASKALLKHRALPLNEEEALAIPSTCDLHDNRPIEYFCETDQTPICSHCVIVGEHKEHAISAMEEKNKMAATQLEPALLKANLALNMLKKSDRVLTGSLPEVRHTMVKLADGLREHFQSLHGALQAREFELLRKLEESFQVEAGPIDDLRSKLLSQTKTLQGAIRDANKILSTSTSQDTLNTQVILHRLTKGAEQPCYVQKQHSTEPELKVLLDRKAMFESIRNYGNVAGKPPCRLVLRNLDEVPDDVIEAEDSVSIVSSTTDGYTDLTSEADNISVTSESSHTNSTGSGLAKSKAPKKKKTKVENTYVEFGKQEYVYITHIKNPGHFFVQKVKNFEGIKKMMHKIAKHCMMADVALQKVDTISKGDMVLGRYSSDKQWYRAKVTNLVYSDDGPPNVEILFIDYGNSEVVHVDFLKPMPAGLANIPIYGRLCCLVGIVPATEDCKWSGESVREFAKMTNDRPMLMNVLDQTDTTLMVDLSKPAQDNIEDDRPVSIRDALVFLELACFQSPNSIPDPNTGLRKPQKRYFRPDLPRLDATAPVIISHINNPSDFYIQMLDSEEMRYLADMSADLQTEYMKDKKDLYAIYCPRIDLVCVAKYTLDDRWYRAKVTSLPGGRLVSVQYVDFGNAETVNYSRLKKLLDKFLVLPAQGISACLAQVTPTDPQLGWSPEAQQLISDFSKRQLYVVVKAIHEGTQLSVLLYDSTDKQCLNKLLVKQGYAISTGPASEPDSVSQQLNLEATTTEKPDATSPTKSRSIKPKVKVKGMKPKGAEVKVSEVMTPGKFYVQMATAEEDGLKKLMEDLQEDYSSKTPTRLSWKLEDYCVAKYSQNDLWHRAKVNSIVDDDTVEVIMVDYGYHDTLPMGSLMPLDDKYKEVNAMSLQCHLADIQPAGDVTRWSQTAVEFIKRELTSDEVFYLEQKGDPQPNMSLPVDLFLEDYIAADALNADRVQYRSLTKMLKGKGLALPKRGKSISPRTSSPADVTTPQENTPTECTPSMSGVEESQDTSSSHVVVSETFSEQDLAAHPGLAESVMTPARYTGLEFPPHEMPTSDTFTVVPTYVDYSCNVYVQVVQDSEEDGSLLGQMMDTIQERYRGTDPDLNQSWEPGQPVIAYYKEDAMYYRAKIRKLLDDGKILVFYVDFGNTAAVNPDDIRSDIILSDIPCQCIPMHIKGLLPVSEDGSWPIETLNTLHNILVNQTCTVKVQTPATTVRFMEVNIILENGTDVTQFMSSKGLTYMEGQEVTHGDLLEVIRADLQNDIELQAADSTTRMVMSADGTTMAFPIRRVASPYSQIPVTQDQEMFVSITQIDSPNYVYYQYILHEDAEPGSMEETINGYLKQLQVMNEVLCRQNTVFPRVTEPKPGTICCGQYSADQLWYRGEIIDVHDDLAAVVFVDYGSQEWVNLTKIRQLPDEYHKLPAQSRRCRLAALRPPETGWAIDEYMYIQALLLSAQALVAVVNHPGDEKLEPVIGLFNPESDDITKYVYYDLIPPDLQQKLMQPEPQGDDNDDGAIIEEEYEEAISPEDTPLPEDAPLPGDDTPLTAEDTHMPPMQQIPDPNKATLAAASIKSSLASPDRSPSPNKTAVSNSVSPQRTVSPIKANSPSKISSPVKSPSPSERQVTSQSQIPPSEPKVLVKASSPVKSAESSSVKSATPMGEGKQSSAGDEDADTTLTWEEIYDMDMKDSEVD